MTVKTKYSPNDNVKFYSPDLDRDLDGQIISITITAFNNHTSLYYTIEADEEIKSNSTHISNEENVLYKLKS